MIPRRRTRVAARIDETNLSREVMNLIPYPERRFGSILFNVSIAWLRMKFHLVPRSRGFVVRNLASTESSLCKAPSTQFHVELAKTARNTPQIGRRDCSGPDQQ